LSRKRTAAFVIISLVALASFNPLRIPKAIGAYDYDLGVKHLKAGRNREAANAFRAATQFTPRNQRAHIDLGDALLRSEDYGAAGEAFREALKLGDDSCAFCGLGAACYKTGRYEEAERAFRRAEELSPGDSCAYDWSGRMYYDLGRFDEAAAAFEHEVRITPDAVFPLHYLGNSYGYLGRWAESAAVYRRLLAVEPDYEDAHYQLGVALFYLKEYREAVAAYRRALELKADDRRAVYGLALTHAALGEGRSADAYRERLRGLDPEAAAELSEALGEYAPGGRR
jgi:superkiller protein 3